MTTSSMPVPLADTYSVDVLQIYRSTPDEQMPSNLPVFNNSLNQCKVFVKVRLLKNNNPFPISLDDAKKALRLTRYDGLSEIAHRTSFENHPDIVSSYTQQGYEYNEAIIQKAQQLRSALDRAMDTPLTAVNESDPDTVEIDGQSWSKPFFMSTLELAIDERARLDAGLTVGPMPCPEPSARPRLVHDISMPEADEGAHVVEFLISTSIAGNNPSAIQVGAAVRWPPDSSTPLAHTGQARFKSYVNIVPVNFPQLGIGGFGNRRDGDDALDDREYTSGVAHVEVFEQWITVNLGDTPLRLWSGATATGWHHYFSLHRHNGTAGSREWAMTYVGQPGSTTPTWDLDDITHLHYWHGELACALEPALRRAAPQIRNADPTRLVIGMLLGNVHWQFTKGGKIVADKNEIKLYVIDVYGNHHRIAILLKDKQFNYVRIATW
jgi:hypothetical protein